MFDDFKKLAESESRKFNDATIEMDVLLKKTAAISTSLTASIKDIEAKFNIINQERNGLKKIEDDIVSIAAAGKEANKQIEFIAAAKEDFKDLTKKINFLNDGLAGIKNESNELILGFTDKLRERSREISEELYLQANQISESFTGREENLIRNSEQKISAASAGFNEALALLEQRLENTGEAVIEELKARVDGVAKTVEGAANLSYQINTMKTTMSDLENTVFAEIKAKSGEIKKDISASVEEFQEIKSSIYEKLNGEIEALSEKIKSVETGIAQNRDSIISSFNSDTLKAKSELEELSENIFDALKEKSSDFKDDISQSMKEFIDHKDKMFESVDFEINKIHGKLKNVEENVEESRQKLVRSFESEAEKVRSEFDNLSLHAVSKKDEIIKAARKEAEDIRNIMDEFEEKYSKIETRLINTAEEKIEHLNEEFISIETRFGSLEDRLGSYENELSDAISDNLEGVKKEFGSLEKRLGDIKSEIVKYEENNKIFSRSDLMIQKVDESLAHFGRILADSKEEAKGLTKFLSEIDHIKDMKKKVEKEIRAYQAKKEKLDAVESEIKGLLELSDIIMEKTQVFNENIFKINQVNGRIDLLGESYKGLSLQIDELKEYEDLIAKNLESASKSEIIIRTVENKVAAFQKVIDKSDKRIDKMSEYLHKIEETTLILKSREREIQEVKDKFSEIDSISSHIERRIEQINAMFNKVESLKDDLDTTDGRLQEMYHQTDRKIKQLSDFIQSVDNAGPLAKQVKGDAQLPKNINESVIKTVRELSKKGWPADEISKKLLIDENSIRFIINTASL
jgi:chromosome segregation ATPase